MLVEDEASIWSGSRPCTAHADRSAARFERNAVPSSARALHASQPLAYLAARASSRGPFPATRIGTGGTDIVRLVSRSV
jgi:hypothetical protein